MKTKILSTRNFADIKRMAQIVNPKVSRKATLLKQKAKIDAELDELDSQIASLEAGIKIANLGLGTEQLVKKVVTGVTDESGNPKMDPKTGKQLTKTTYEPLECLQYDADKNQYILTVNDEEDVHETALEAADEFSKELAPEAAPTDVMEGPESSDDNPFGY